jgi:hypothetical protein
VRLRIIHDDFLVEALPATNDASGGWRMQWAA